MQLWVDISGLNLERLLRTAAQQGVTLRGVSRRGERTMRVRIPFWRRRALAKLCERCGWEMSEVAAGRAVRAGRFLRARRMLAVGAALGAALLYLSSQTVLAVRVEGAQEHVAEVRRYLNEQHIGPGRLKWTLSADALRDGLALRLPGLSFAGVRYAGSTLVVECEPAREGEQLGIEGGALDIVAREAGVVTRIWVQSGTPMVKEGQAVRAGQVLIRGQERTGSGATRSIKAQGQVLARVWVQGEARASLWQTQTVETGETRTRVTLCTPWHERVVQDAEPFASQDVSVRTERVVGLYLPVWRRIETMARTRVTQIARDRGDAASMAQGAAEELAKIKCPAGAQILDKWTEYSMIDDEFVYATVILEYERDIAARTGS